MTRYPPITAHLDEGPPVRAAPRDAVADELEVVADELDAAAHSSIPISRKVADIKYIQDADPLNWGLYVLR